jgi:(4S)-4-hydroxy-5-phosphonooxypentane-2,3-dione isomerase
VDGRGSRRAAGVGLRAKAVDPPAKHLRRSEEKGISPMVQDLNLAKRETGPASASQHSLAPKTLYAITVAFKLKDGSRDAFHRLARENARESVETEADCLRFDVLTPADSQEEVLLYEIYTDRAAFDRHLATPHFRRFDEATRVLVRRKTVVAYFVQESSKAETA